MSMKTNQYDIILFCRETLVAMLTCRAFKSSSRGLRLWWACYKVPIFNKNNAGAMEKKTSLTELHLQNYAKHATVLCNLCQTANDYPPSIIMKNSHNLHNL